MTHSFDVEIAKKDDSHLTIKVGFIHPKTEHDLFRELVNSAVNAETGEPLTEDQLFSLGKMLMEYAQHLVWRKNPPYLSNNEPKKAKAKSMGYVYLMKDDNTGFHKIGFSKKPEYRESTLQAQTPLVNLVGKVAASIDVEKKLHNEFASKRLRGEWFNLDNDEVASILTFFQSVA